MSLISHLIPQKKAEFTSPIHGKIQVIESMGKLYIDVGGLMQSGSFLELTWRKGLEKLHVFDLPLKKVLILGLAGGSFIKMLRKRFPEVYVTGVDIDATIVEVGKQYFGLQENAQTQIVIADANKYVYQIKQQYDLIFIDLYNGYDFPAFAESEKFLKQLQSLLTENGCLIFNRLFFQKHKNEAKNFLDKLRKIFEDVDEAKVYANILIKVS